MLRLIVALSALLFIGVVQAQDGNTSQMSNGRLWIELDQMQRVLYLGAFRDAYVLSKVRLDKDGSSCNCQIEWAARFTIGDFVKALDRFYDDPENVLIPIPLAFLHLNERFKGVWTEEKLQETLRNLRRVGK
jgi:hypothetical protein